MGKVIAIFNQKGGVGKTTTTINLAYALSQKGKRILICDIDPQGNTTSGIGVDKNEIDFSMYDVLLGDVSQIKQNILKTKLENIYMLPSSMDLSGAEVELVGVKQREKVLKEALDKIKAPFDFVFIDCPPSLGLLTINALTVSDTVLIPIQCEFYALEGVSQLMNTISLVKNNLNPRIQIEGVLLSMFDGRTNLSLQVVEEVKKYFGNKVYKSVIPRNVRLAEAPSYGLPVAQYDPHSTGAKAYEEFSVEFLEGNK